MLSDLTLLLKGPRATIYYCKAWRVKAVFCGLTWYFWCVCMFNNEPTPFTSVQQPCPFTVTLKLYLDASLHVFLPCHVALTPLSLVLLVSQMTRLPITDATFLDYVKMSSKTQPGYISTGGSDSSLGCGVWSVPPGSSEEPSSRIMVFGSLVLTTESGLFSIACHLIWSNTSSSVGSVPFFQILRESDCWW